MGFNIFIILTYDLPYSRGFRFIGTSTIFIPKKAPLNKISVHNPNLLEYMRSNMAKERLLKARKPL